jgi:hypothetical protein
MRPRPAEPDDERRGAVDVVEIAVAGQESWIQLAGTAIHDLLTALTLLVIRGC